ncbi:MAG TPA: hypothetical protein PLO14_03500 [Accumulibacter sp.]|nr:hypothetical protein [Accumulibacter sp.]
MSVYILKQDVGLPRVGDPLPYAGECRTPRDFASRDEYTEGDR